MLLFFLFCWLAQGLLHGRYIVILKDTVTASEVATHVQRVKSLHASLGAVDHKGQSYAGFLEHFSNIGAYSIHAHKDVIRHIQGQDEVLIVHEDTRVQAHQAAAIVEVGSKQNQIIQTHARPGLSRISHVTLANTAQGHYAYNPTGQYAPKIYSLDSGVLASHIELSDRVQVGPNFSSNSSSHDVYGHGTHVAGILIGETLGVARNVDILLESIKILDDEGSGTASSVIAGVDYVLGQSDRPDIFKIINISFGGPLNPALDKIIESSAAKGIHIVVSAGNDNANVNAFSPARASDIIVVAAIDANDRRAVYSNYGDGITFAAPGNDVLSAWINGDESTYVQSGTSMAAPHVVGVLAELLSIRGGMTPDTARKTLAATSQVEALGFLTPVKIIYNNSGR